jgi:hypothetical protein
MTAVSLAGTPIPVATVQPAPAAAPADIQSAYIGALAAPEGALVGSPLANPLASSSAPAGASASASAAAEGEQLIVPQEFLDKLAKAVADGRKDAAAFAAEHTPSERWMVPDWALLKMAFAPREDSEELAYLHKVADGRTDAGIERARYWSKHGLTDEWIAMLGDYIKKVGPAQARAATKLMHDALMMVNNVTQTGKSANLRKRPFAVDETLKLAVDKPGNNPSYPSGHASAAFAAGLVLSHLMPDRAAEFMGMAQEASWARVYAGVHFPTDVLAGAKLATTVASHLIATSQARPVTGTAPAVNPGVAGGRKRLPGAAQLAGQPITGPTTVSSAPGPSPAAPVMAPGQPGT